MPGYQISAVTNILFPKFEEVINKLRAWASPQLWVYDIETYPNYFSCAVINVKTLECYYFELSPWYNNMAEFSQFLYYLAEQKAEMVGFNNQHFDWPVVDRVFKLIKSQISNDDIMSFVDSIFKADFQDRFKHVIWRGEQFVGQIDLFKINHYDNNAKSTSLKMLENNMGMDNIQELPIEPGTFLTLEQRNEMYLYNWHDVAATLLFLAYNTGDIDLRATLTQKFEHDFTNASEAKIGADIFKLELKKAGLSVYDQTYRKQIDFSECIFNYVGFERVEFQAVHNWLMKTKVTQTKEVLNDIEVPWELALHMNPELVTVHGLEENVLAEMKLRKGAKVKLSLVPAVEHLNNCVFIADHLHVVVDGFQFDFGTGGIHGSINNSIVKTTATHSLVDVDVASYYPNLAIKNKVYPQHLGPEFCDIYENIYIMRGNYKKKTHPKENKAIKLALNAAYGNSNNQYSFLFDSKYTMTITLNGQLLLCMLAEQLFKVPGLTLVQINTDGVTYHCPHQYVEHTLNLCRWWESFTGLTLEDVTYKAMYIRDVNNYIAVDDSGDTKWKGAYEYNLAETGQWHKNFSMLIVPMAAEAALLRGVHPEEFIAGHLHTLTVEKLFCGRTKVNRQSKLLFVDSDGVEQPVQRVTRYYASKTGGSLIKVMKPTPAQIKLYREGDHYQHESTGDYVVKKTGVAPPSGRYKPVPEHLKQPVPDRRFLVEASCKIKPCNDIADFDWNDLDLDFYVTEINKLVVPLLQ